MSYKVHCHVGENQFYETTLNEPDAVVDFVCAHRSEYPSIMVYLPEDNGMFNCNLAIIDGHAQWGEYSLLQAVKIREQELDCWPNVSASEEYKRVTLEQVNEYIAHNEGEILDSLWPVLPEVAEVVEMLAYENNTDLFNASRLAAADGVTDSEDILPAQTMQM